MTPPAVTPQPDNLIPSTTDPARFGWGSAIAMAIPALLLGWLVYTNAVNVPYMDEWDEVSFIVKEANGTLGFHDFWKQHNEHRLIVPRAFFAVASRLSEGDYRAMMAVSVALVCVAAVNVFVLLRKTVHIERRWLRIALALLISSLLFSPAQEQNWLWGFQIQFFLPFVCATTAAVVAYQPWQARWRYAVCALIAGVSTYSLASGMLAWFAYPLMLLMVDTGLHRRGTTLRLLTFWAFTGAICIGSYLYGYEKPPGHPSLLAAMHKPVDAVGYMLVSAGGALARVSSGMSPLKVAGAVGGAAALILLVCLRKFIIDMRVVNGTKDALFIRRLGGWSGILFFTLGTMFLSCLGRVGFGMAQALESRYATFSVFFLVAVLGVICVQSRRQAERRTHMTIPLLVALLLFVQMAVWTQGATQMRGTSMARLMGKAGMQFATILPQDMPLGILHPNPQRVRDNARRLFEVGRLYPGLMLSTDPTPRVNVRLGSGYMNSPVYLPDNRIILTGWAARTDSPQPTPDRPGTSRIPDAILFSFDRSDGTPVLFRMISASVRDRLHADLANPARPDLKWSMTLERASADRSIYTLKAWGLDARTLELFPVGQPIRVGSP